MIRKDYNSSKADYIVLKFKCTCGEIINTGLMPVKRCYDNNKNEYHFSHDKPIICPKCKKKHEVAFFDNMLESYCEIPTLDGDDSLIFLHEIPYEYAKDYDNSFIDYCGEICKLSQFVDNLKTKDNATHLSLLSKMAYTYAISIMDAYLGNNFRYYVSHCSLFKERYLQYKSNGKKINAKDIMEKLRYCSFQNLKETVIPYYEHTFELIVPQNDIIQNAIQKRNSFAHNYGRERDGYENLVSIGELEKLIEEIRSLVFFIEDQMRNIIFEDIIWPNMNESDN